jgi:hypothetical protein
MLTSLFDRPLGPGNRSANATSAPCLRGRPTCRTGTAGAGRRTTRAEHSRLGRSASRQASRVTSKTTRTGQVTLPPALGPDQPGDDLADLCLPFPRPWTRQNRRPGSSPPRAAASCHRRRPRSTGLALPLQRVQKLLACLLIVNSNPAGTQHVCERMPHAHARVRPFFIRHKPRPPRVIRRLTPIRGRVIVSRRRTRLGLRLSRDQARGAQRLTRRG